MIPINNYKLWLHGTLSYVGDVIETRPGLYKQYFHVRCAKDNGAEGDWNFQIMATRWPRPQLGGRSTIDILGDFEIGDAIGVLVEIRGKLNNSDPTKAWTELDALTFKRLDHRVETPGIADDDFVDGDITYHYIDRH